MTVPVHERLYDLVANDDDARVCAALPEQACRVVPGNFFLILASLVLTKLGDLLISPKIVLTWLMGAVGAPAALTALLVPIRESGSMLPQLLLGAWVRQRALAKRRPASTGASWPTTCFWASRCCCWRVAC